MTTPRNDILFGDVREVMRGLDEGSVNCIITSPPYWSLRKYDIPDVVWDGVEGCEHEWGDKLSLKKCGKPTQPVGIFKGRNLEGIQSGAVIPQGQFCLHCSAWRGQLGLEPNISLYLSHLMQIMDECKRVLRDDGTMWVNLGDSYFGDSPVRKSASEQFDPEYQTVLKRSAGGDRRSAASLNGLRAKSLCLIPERFTIEMVNRGWILRNKICWHKPNCMPSSVRDRFTMDWEPVYFFVKSRKYWFEQQYEPQQTESIEREKHGFNVYPRSWNGEDCPVDGGKKINFKFSSNGRNRRCVWTIPTQPYPESHFACVDEETECLTPAGWLKYQDLQIGQAIAAYDMRNEKAVWTSIQDLKSYSVKNEGMVRVLGRAVDMLLTPNHRCVIKRRDNETKQWERTNIVEAKDLKVSHKIIVAPKWETFAECKLHKNLIALIGWYVTEGSTGSDNISIYQSQSANPMYCNEIRTLLIQLGATHTEHSYRRKYMGKDTVSTTWRITGAVATELLSLCPRKTLPTDFLFWDNVSLHLLWETLMKGDGNFRDGGRQTFVQKNKILIDQVQALATRLSMPTTLRKRSEGTWGLYKTNQKDRLLRKETGGLISNVKYSGIVWCPKTAYGTFIARRNGRIFVTGNTFPERLVEPMILAGCPKGGLVLDPFIGSGTVAKVASRLGRDFLGIELGDEYVEMAWRRIMGIKLKDIVDEQEICEEGQE